MNRLSVFNGMLCLSLMLLARTAQAGTELVATQSLTVQPNGSRTGEAGKQYFNIEGKDNGKFASFGVLVFDLPKEIQDKKLKGLELSLIQTTPKFAKDGALKFFLAPNLDPAASLKFDAETADGVGKQIETLHPIGTGEFKTPEQGKAQKFTLTLSDAIRGRIAKGGKLCLVVVPADEKVAATYFGANDEAKDKCPKLTFEVP